MALVSPLSFSSALSLSLSHSLLKLHITTHTQNATKPQGIVARDWAPSSSGRRARCDDRLPWAVAAVCRSVRVCLRRQWASYGWLHPILDPVWLSRIHPGSDRDDCTLSAVASQYSQVLVHCHLYTLCTRTRDSSPELHDSTKGKKGTIKKNKWRSFQTTHTHAERERDRARQESENINLCNARKIDKWKIENIWWKNLQVNRLRTDTFVDTRDPISFSLLYTVYT